MLPIPVPIIRTKQLFIPVVYVLTTLILCHLFITVFVGKDKQVSALLNSEGPKVKSKNNLRAYRSVQETNEIKQNVSGRSHSAEIRLRHQNQGLVDMDISTPGQKKWTEDPECRNLTIQFAERGTFLPRALVSFPGSGNTWLRHLIETSSGIFTGSIFNDKIIFENGLLGELSSPSDGSTILQKTHHSSTIFASQQMIKAYVKVSELMFRYRGILLIRNPYDALISYWNFKTTRSHKGAAYSSSFNTEAWKKFVRKGSEAWFNLIRDWVTNSRELLIVLYEDLKNDTAKEVVRILKYLEQPVNGARLRCTTKFKEGSFHRNHENQTTICPFEILDPTGRLTLDLIVQKRIGRVNAFLADYGYPLKLNYTPPACLKS